MDEVIESYNFHQNPTHVLYLSYDGMTDPLGQSQVLPYLIGLSKHGFKFHIISFEKRSRFELHKEHIQQICDANGIVWHPLKYSEGNPVFSTVWDIYKMKKQALKLHKEFNFELTHCRSYISALIGLSMKRKHNVKFVFDMRGFWADERVDGGLWDLDNPIFKKIYNYFKKKEISYFNESDYTISLTHNGKKEIESWKVFQTAKPKIQVIPCCVDLELFKPESIDEKDQEVLRKKIGISKQDYIIGYVGSIGTWYMLSEMLDFFKFYKERNQKAKFLFVTGEKPETIRKELTYKKIDEKDVIITSCLHKEVPLNISLFNESIFFIRPTYSKKASSPTKQGEIMAMGIPLICNSGVGDTDFVVEKYNAGSIISKFDAEAYSSIDAKKDLNIEKIKKGAQEFYSLEEGVKKYLEVYQSLTSRI
ncbi:MAG: glycosyltransferase [Flavobacteriia bacterium]|nr:glycosyltransferase [Flavobacteriia bacterium]